MTEIEALRKKHADVFNNPAVDKIAYWRQPNSGSRINEKKYHEKCKKAFPKFLALFDKTNLSK